SDFRNVPTPALVSSACSPRRTLSIVARRVKRDFPGWPSARGPREIAHPVGEVIALCARQARFLGVAGFMMRPRMNPPHPRPNPPTRTRTSGGRYSIWRLLCEGLRGQRGWTRAWSKATPRPRYRVVIVGGGGHGLSTAFHLAAEHGITDVAVLER